MRITSNIFTLADLYGPLMGTLGLYKRAPCCAGEAGVTPSPKEVIQKNIYFEYLIKQCLSPDKHIFKSFPSPSFLGFV